MPNPLIPVALWCYRRPWPVLAASLLALVACLAASWFYLGLQMDWTYLFSREDPFIQRELAFRREFPLPKDMVVLVDGGTPAGREAFLQRLALRLEQDPRHFRHVFYRLDLDFVRRHALFYLTREQLQRLDAELRFLQPYLVALQERPALVALLGQLERDLGPEASPERTLPALTLANGMLAELLQSLHTRGGHGVRPQALLPDLVPARAPVDLEEMLQGQRYLYHTLEGGAIHLLFVKPGQGGDAFAPAGPSVDRLRQVVKETAARFPGLRARISGEPVLLTDERRTCHEDSQRSTALSLFLIGLLFVLGFGERRRPLMAMFALVVGLGLALGFTTLAVGHLNFITVTYISMLAGEGIAFGIHLTFRYSQERMKGKEPEEALRETMGQTGMNVAVGALATAVSFFVMCWTGFLGVAELGLIAGVGVLLVCLATVTALPACLALHERAGGGRRKEIRGAAALAGLDEMLGRHPRILVLGLALFSLACLTWGGVVRFDYNLLNMQDPGLESIRTEIEMIQQGQSTALPAVSLAPDLEEASRRAARFARLPAVSRVISLSDLVPPGAAERVPLVEQALEPVRGLEIPPPEPLARGRDLLEIEGAVERLESAFLAAQPGFRGPEVAAEARRFADNLQAVREQVEAMGPGPVVDSFAAVQTGLVGNVRLAVRLLGEQEARAPALGDVPEEVLVRSVGSTGKIALRILSHENIWEREPQERFASQVASVDPEALGEPILMVHFGDVIADTHRRFAWNTLLAVSLVMFLYLGSWRVLVLSMIPTALGVLWMVGVMGLCGIDFNPANFVALPMIVGIGAIYGVHVLHRMEEEGSASILSHSTGPAVLLSGLNTIAGFGSLLIAHHRGIASLGFMISVGVAANLVASLVLLPALYRWSGAESRRWAARARKADPASEVLA